MIGPEGPRGEGERACKPGSVLPRQRRSFICETCHHVPVATYPEAGASSACCNSSTLPYLVLLRMGFTLPPMLVGAVRSYRTISPLPDEETLARRYIFCGTFRGLTSPRRYLASCSMEPGLSSNPHRRARLRNSAIAQPAPLECDDCRRLTQSLEPMSPSFRAPARR